MFLSRSLCIAALFCLCLAGSAAVLSSDAPSFQPSFVAKSADQRMPVVAASPSTFLLVWPEEDNAYLLPHRLLGLRIDSQGAPFDSRPFLINQSLYRPLSLAVASDGTNFLVAWVNSTLGLFVTMVRSDGTVSVTNGIPVEALTGTSPPPKLIGGAEGFLLLWEDWTIGPTRGARISSAGTVLTPGGVPMELLPGMEGVLGSDGSNYIYVACVLSNSNFGTFRWRIAQANASVSGAAQIQYSDTYSKYYSLAFNGSRFLLTARDSEVSTATFLHPDGTYLGQGPGLSAEWKRFASASARGEFMVLTHTEDDDVLQALRFSASGNLISSNQLPIPGESLWHDNVFAASSHSYLLCHANYSNVVASVLSTNGALLNQFSPQTGPRILSLSPPTFGALGDTVELSVIAEGLGPIRYQWFNNGIAVVNATNATIAFQSSLNTVGTYSLRVTDAIGSTFSAGIPVVAISPLSDQWTPLNGSATFTLNVLGTLPDEIQWKFAGAALSNETSQQLKLTNVTLAGAGTYTAQLRFGSNATSVSARLFVTDQVGIEWERTIAPSGTEVTPYDTLQVASDHLGHIAVLRAGTVKFDLCVFDTNGESLNCAFSTFDTDISSEGCVLATDTSGRLYFTSVGFGPIRNVFVRQYSPLATNLNWTSVAHVATWNRTRQLLADDSGYAYVLVSGSSSIYGPHYSGLAISKLGVFATASETNYVDTGIFSVYQEGYDPALNANDMTFVSTNDLALVWYHGPTNFITRLDRDGTIRWTRVTPFVAQRIVADKQDNLLITGSGVAKYSRTGDLMWVRPAAQLAGPLAADSGGNVVALSSHTTKFDSQGKPAWASPISGNYIKIDEHDNAYVSGSLSKSDGTSDLFVAKLATNGVVRWQAIYNGEQDASEVNGGIDVERDGVVYLCASDTKNHLIKFIERDSAGAPAVGASPGVRLIEAGSAGTLAATVNGSDLTFQWLRDGVPVPGATNQTLSFTSFQNDQSGGYSVRVQNSFGWVLGTETFVTSPLTLFGVARDQPPNTRSFRFLADARFTYEVQSSTDLVSWTPVATFAGTNGAVAFSATNNVASRFYRVRVNR